MECPRCGYTLDTAHQECPRCAQLDAATAVPEQPVPQPPDQASTPFSPPPLVVQPSQPAYSQPEYAGQTANPQPGYTGQQPGYTLPQSIPPAPPPFSFTGQPYGRRPGASIVLKVFLGISIGFSGLALMLLSLALLVLQAAYTAVGNNGGEWAEATRALEPLMRFGLPLIFLILLVSLGGKIAGAIGMLVGKRWGTIVYAVIGGLGVLLGLAGRGYENFLSLAEMALTTAIIVMGFVQWGSFE